MIDSGHDHGPESDEGGQPPGGPGYQRHHDRGRGQTEAGGKDRVVPDPGEEQNAAEQHGEESHGVSHCGRVGDRKRPGPKQLEVDGRLGVAAAPPDEHST